MARYIDADALVEHLYKRYCIPCIKYEHSRSRCAICKINLYLDIVAEAPTADVVEVRHGEWIDDHRNRFHCSDCGKTYQLGSVQTIYDVKRCWVYCPNCGAKMDKGVIA